MATTRSITAECASGDGAELEVTTADQAADDDVVLTFRCTDSEGMAASVRVTAEQLDEITPFLYREREAYEVRQEDEFTACGHSLEGADCALVDEHASVFAVPAVATRAHVTTAGVTWVAED